MKQRLDAASNNYEAAIDRLTLKSGQARTLYQAMCRIKTLAQILNGVDVSDYSQTPEIADDVDALSYAIKEIAEKAMQENEQ